VDGTTTTTADAIGIIANLCAAVVGITIHVVVWQSCTAHTTVVVAGSIIITGVVGGIIANPCAAVVGIG